MTETDLEEYRGVPLRMTKDTYIIQSSHDETLGDYTAEAAQLLADLHDYVMDNGDIAPIHELYHTITDKIGHRLTKEFLADHEFYSMLSSVFQEPIYPFVNRQPHPDSGSPF